MTEVIAEPQSQTGSPPPQQAVLQLITGKWVSQAIYVAAELGIFDRIGDGELTAKQLAGATTTFPDRLYRLLRALGSVGVLEERKGRRFRNTPLGHTLREDVPGSLRGFARLAGMEMSWRGWGELLYAIETGECAFAYVAGEDTFDYLSTRPYEAGIVNSAMTSMSALEAQGVVAAYDFSVSRTVIDVGGGHGLLLSAILEANPHLNGVLYELPHAVEGAREAFAARGLADRAEAIAGDALERVPFGADTYLLKHIIHDWADDPSIRFLRNIAKVLPEDGRLLIVEMVLTPPGEPHFSKLLDLEMLVMSPGGKERTIEDYEALLAQAGLRLSRLLPTEGPNSIIEAVKA